MNMKGNISRLLLFVAVCFLTVNSVAAQTASELPPDGKYQIQSVVFNSQGITRPEMIQRKILPIEYNTVFESKQAFDEYVASVKQQIENLRLLENISYIYYVAELSPDQIYHMTVDFTFSDSKSRILIPYPSADSNEGIKFSVVFTDSNFLGLTNPFFLVTSVQFGTEKDPDDYSDITPAVTVGYNYPFSIGKTKNSWLNSIDFAWTIGDSSPKFNLNTGVDVGIPLGENFFHIAFLQSAVMDPKFEKYDDKLYFKEFGKLSLPLTVGEVSNSPVIYTPFVSAAYNWDKNGINKANYKLHPSPALTAGQTITLNHINWSGNFREGYFFTTTQSITRDFSKSSMSKMFSPLISANGSIYKGFGMVGLEANASFFATLNAVRNIGFQIRGVLDLQTFAPPFFVNDDNYALETDSAIVFNVELPIHIITTNWRKWFHAEDSDSKMATMMEMLDFELQLSPFFDMGLIKNKVSGNAFKPKEGLYGAGIEAIVYPAKWRSHVVRVSLGFDIGKKFLNTDTSWRRPKKSYELFVGLGHMF